MGRINVTDEWLYQHMPLVNEEIMRELEEQADEGCQFSRQFEDNMKKIIRKEKCMGRRKRAKTHAAAAAACMAVFLSAAAVSVYGDEIKFYGTMKTLWKKSFIYSYFREAGPDGLKARKPGYVPSGYKMVSEDINEAAASFLYQDASGRQMVFLQQSVSEGGEIAFDSEYDWGNQIKITGGLIEAHWYQDGRVCCYLEYREHVFILNADSLDNDDIKKIYTEWIHNKN